MRIVRAGFTDPQLIHLLEFHVATARSETARYSAHALDLDALQVPDISVWAVWEEDLLLGVGALKALTPEHGELKSMHTLQTARRRGAGGAMLRHLIETARAQGMTRLSLETGSWPYFDPARALYARHGFTECAPFGDYAPDPNSVFMTLALR